MKRIAQTAYGKVKGLQGNDARITVYKGIPFAAPPVGERRFRPPQPCEKWEGILKAFEFGPISVQDTPGLGDDLYCREWHVDPDIPMDEDCLYLNIWTPAKEPDEKLPVLVWYFGGGYQWGYTAEMEFDGERLASRNIIVVSINYRLGVFGFLSHPEITRENPDAPGNFGLLDQQAGLKWVYENIAAFGGDPEKITIAGQSAGGNSVMNQLAFEGNAHMIRSAVIYSGIIRFPENEKARDLFDPPVLSEAEKRGEDFFSYIGVKSLEEARSISALEIRDKYERYREDHPFFANIRDGRFCKKDPYETFIEGGGAKVPVISGNTVDEFVTDGVNTVEISVKEVFDGRIKNDSSAKLFYYRFSCDIPGDDAPGCFHSCDLWFFFETLMKCRRPFEGRHFDLARTMCDYIANFVKTGDPNGTDAFGNSIPVWRPYSLEEKNGIDFTGGGPRPFPV
ncbi:MAG: carboxylesterase family protein [Lachnospiraceae bacterium]|nr:carboxylesterase family protein [Lachnospiraceae bacterium]